MYKFLTYGVFCKLSNFSSECAEQFLFLSKRQTRMTQSYCAQAFFDTV